MKVELSKEELETIMLALGDRMHALQHFPKDHPFKRSRIKDVDNLLSVINALIYRVE